MPLVSEMLTLIGQLRLAGVGAILHELALAVARTVTDNALPKSFRLLVSLSIIITT